MKRKKERVVIIGAGGHGRVIADTVRCCGDEVLGFLDDRDSGLFAGLNILGRTCEAQRLAGEDVKFVIGVGQNEIRKRIATSLLGFEFYTAIHPSAVIAEDVDIGAGTVILPNAVVNTGSKIGCQCIINTAATVDHDNLISDYVHVSPGAHLAGTVSVGEGAWVGAGAVISNNVKVCGDCIIGAGAVVIKEICVPGTYVGVPAKRIGSV